MKTDQFALFEPSSVTPEILSLPPLGRVDARRAIEDEDFPFEQLSDIAEAESWRKEVHRPLYHIHKWWAQRLGSVFRAIILGSFAPSGTDILSLFYSSAKLPDIVIFDPFMGSGTTIGETLKLGGRAIGRDINPVAYFLVRNAINIPKKEDLVETFREIERDVSPQIQRFFEAKLPGGRKARVLYYFWVKQLPCPGCNKGVDLFSSYVFARHAYASRFPEAQILCPACGKINVGHYDSESFRCGHCKHHYDPSKGPARGVKATCPACHETFSIMKAVQHNAEPPPHRMYAKLILLPNGHREYVPTDRFDLELYAEAERELKGLTDAYPRVRISPGYNTNQVLNYSYRYWHQMFNARQLLCLGLLANRIRKIRDERHKELFCCLYSGVLEFNNMFASFKGEGTGAVRHMFSHHILKPERAPLEANPWGTPKSSGSFSTLFQTRILRAIEYCSNPFEIRPPRKDGQRHASEKVFGLSFPIFHDVADCFSEFLDGKDLYLSRGDSTLTDLSDECVDAVITDPPFFDNVHYSQLADFFFVWQQYILGPTRSHSEITTRSDSEVQCTEPGAFRDRLANVWRECRRVLKEDGLLVFTYHHSRQEGWQCLLDSLMTAGFVVTRTHPVKAEMSVATPKRQTKHPIDLDIIVVCRKRTESKVQRHFASHHVVKESSVREAETQLHRLSKLGRSMSRSDIHVVLMAQIIARLSNYPSGRDAQKAFEALETGVEESIERLYRSTKPS